MGNFGVGLKILPHPDIYLGEEEIMNGTRVEESNLRSRQPSRMHSNAQVYHATPCKILSEKSI